jgi:cobaltochelatase CobS
MTDPHSDLGRMQVIDLDAGDIFSGQPSGRLIKGYASPCLHTPVIDPDYLFHDAVRELVVWFLSPTDPLYVFGPTGSGKSSLVRQVAAKLNYPVFDITAHGRLEFSDLAGHLTVDNGSMRFEYGPLALAMKFGGLFLLNEIDLLDPSTAAGLNGVLDGGPLIIPENGGEVIQPHSMFCFVATANTNGGSDETGLYQGTLRQNLAFMDRFWLCEVGYPEAEAEFKLLERLTPALPGDLLRTMVEFANQVRRLFAGKGDQQQPGESIDITFSTRTLIRWSRLTLGFQPLARQGVQPVFHALDRALGFRATPSTRALLHELGQRMFSTGSN